MAQELEVGVHGESDLIEIATRLACEGYWEDIKQVMEVSRVFRYDEQLWDAMKDVPGHGKQRRTRLMYAAWKGDLERVRFLLDRGARVNELSGPLRLVSLCALVRTPLMLACEEGHLAVVIELCDRGANVNVALYWDDFTALILACRKGQTGVAMELCQRGANVNAADAHGSTALMVACTKCPLDLIRELCKWGADVNAVQKYDGHTALMWAAKFGRHKVARELCERGANVNAATHAPMRTRGHTPLIIASSGGFLEVVQALLDHGASKTAVSASGATAFFCAAGAHLAALRALLKP